MTSFVESLRVPLRAGLHHIVRFNLVVAVVGVFTAFAWNPEASADDLVVVVVLPPILVYVVSRASGAFRRAASSEPAQNQGTASADVQRPAAPIQPEEIKKFMLMARLILYSLVLFTQAVGTLLVLPLYAWLGISWAVSYGLFMIAAMFIVGVLVFAFALSRVAPGLWRGIKTVAAPALSRLLPGLVSAR